MVTPSHAMKKLIIIALAFVLPTLAKAQTTEGKSFAYAQMKLWDSHLRYPKINEIEFEGADLTLATYDAIYGHGAMWETDYLGFRIYMDHRQSIDLYGKKKAQLELDSTNFYSNRSWLQRGYGEDILWVGQSVGAGSFRGWRDGKAVYVDTVSARGQRIIDKGPERAVVEVWDRDWKINGRTYPLMVQRYTMLAGSRFFRVDIQIDGAADTDVFATGAQKLESNNQGFIEQVYSSPRIPLSADNADSPNGQRSTVHAEPAWLGAVAGSWGSNVPDKNAPDLVETLGIGIFVPAQYLKESREGEFDYLCLVHPVAGHITYYVAVASDMQEGGQLHSAPAWFEWLREWARKNPHAGNKNPHAGNK